MLVTGFPLEVVPVNLTVLMRGRHKFNLLEGLVQVLSLKSDLW